MQRLTITIAAGLALCVGCSQKSDPPKPTSGPRTAPVSDIDVAACAVETIRRNMASALGDEVVNEMAIDADLETLRAFGDGKWKVAVIIEIPREKIPPGRWSDRVMIDGMNGAAISTVELTDGKLKQTSVDADIDEIVAKFPGTKAAKAAEAKKTRPIIE